MVCGSAEPEPPLSPVPCVGVEVGGEDSEGDDGSAPDDGPPGVPELASVVGAGLVDAMAVTSGVGPEVGTSGASP
jgi:hypothetical protein